MMLVLLSACATSSEVKEIEQMAIEGRETISQIDNKISQLETDRSNLENQLKSINSTGNTLTSEAADIRVKISTINQSIDYYNNEIKVINKSISQNTTNISAVRKQQKMQHDAASLAVKENQTLKTKAVDEIKALELEYEEKRKKALEENKENNDGE